MAGAKIIKRQKAKAKSVRKPKAVVDEEKKALLKERHAAKQLSVERQLTAINIITDLYLKGNSYRKIAQTLEDEANIKISFVMVGNYVNKMLEEWKQERVSKIDDLKTIELTRIAKLENTYWQGWERSLGTKKKNTDRQRAKPKVSVDRLGNRSESMDVQQAEKSIYTEETFGDPRFLDGIKWCIQMRCKILGIEAPTEFKGTFSAKVSHKTVFNTRTRNKPE